MLFDFDLLKVLPLLTTVMYNTVPYLRNHTKVSLCYKKQGRKRPLDTPKRMIKRREREGKRERERKIEGEREG